MGLKMINESKVKKGGVSGSPKTKRPPLPPPQQPPLRLYNGAGVRIYRPPTTEFHNKTKGCLLSGQVENDSRDGFILSLGLLAGVFFLVGFLMGAYFGN